MSEEGIQRIARRFKRDMQGLGVGVSMSVSGGPMVEVVKPPEEGESRERRDMAVMEQLSFDVGGQRPTRMKLGFSGKLGIDEQLLKGDRYAVHVLDLRTGELIAEAAGTVTSVAFVDKTDKDGIVTTTREHRIELDS